MTAAGHSSQTPGVQAHEHACGVSVGQGFPPSLREVKEEKRVHNALLSFFFSYFEVTFDLRDFNIGGTWGAADLAHEIPGLVSRTPSLVLEDGMYRLSLERN